MRDRPYVNICRNDLQRDRNSRSQGYSSCLSGRFIMLLIILATIFSTVWSTGSLLKRPIGEHDGLGQEDELIPPVPVLECSYHDTESRQKLYRDEHSRCEHGYHRSDEKCPGMGDSVSVQGFEITISEVMDAGADGKIYRTSDENLVLKITKHESICNEKAILMALVGTEGDYFPRPYGITSEISDNCKARFLVMDKVGDANWY